MKFHFFFISISFICSAICHLKTKFGIYFNKIQLTQLAEFYFSVSFYDRVNRIQKCLKFYNFFWMHSKKNIWKVDRLIVTGLLVPRHLHYQNHFCVFWMHVQWKLRFIFLFFFLWIRIWKVKRNITHLIEIHLKWFHSLMLVMKEKLLLL